MPDCDCDYDYDCGDEGGVIGEERRGERKNDHQGRTGAFPWSEISRRKALCISTALR